ncbi:ribonuclease H-like YkuK family protein [Bacillus cereus]|uniref:ribonuclease H-like YkuK family protein n=1 Tax=Bacillus cereus TaxID=1396 RepID=UPI00099576B1|nr:ribonuclease H-like YkuK family protein [Bacillus cereus]MDZ4434594.1 ribonuclease H-like YkuK family protein [Bacillus cereus]MDZ4448465.1 ribonuclease H-like YkuK family protein [Bacillus cereus]MDZ4614654.1 ribonuclease H-like YkuK family protein [Bacillus cereus]OPA32930.1 hypothetical protein BHL47_02885 [Bacillus cereus]UDV85309.1 ribonuclease H-like YkuK family protein [Bacillus cereus]
MREIQFQNLSLQNMNFHTVFEQIYSYIKSDPRQSYKLMIGTDSQVQKRGTLFITGSVIQREGKGAWACIRKAYITRQMKVLHERISFETSLTEEVAMLFDERKKERLIQLILPYVYDGGSLSIDGHIDIGSGKRNRTREYVVEMMNRVENMGLDPKIKPESFVASSFANRYTK